MIKKKPFPYTFSYSVVFCNFPTVKELVVLSRKS